VYEDSGLKAEKLLRGFSDQEGMLYVKYAVRVIKPFEILRM
jgi:hypothetical protein